ncbi:amidase [Rhodovulum strictum]|uniref:Amidase n=1 Tax=Rhodovulum strictum TaxID=58314 RepID=A0A844BGV0_9RHOB|nr:amidase [Rhodovulum strictum]MRH20655.1 amidase [Rhodovulum strictum]
MDKANPRARSAAAALSLGAVAIRDKLTAGEFRATDLVEVCLARIAATEPEVQAWAWLDGDHAIAQAEALDRHRESGRAIGPLHGLPVGLKDVIDTAKIPTLNGAALDEGRVPQRDAFVVDRLRAAGAIVMGKTVTTELAFLHPGKTRNPHNPAHTPGGSSSGSAAAVAAGMVPLAVGTQTGGSVIRPASFCGVTGFKPSFGAIPRRGVLMQSPSLDTLGVFAADPLGAALLAEALFGHDAADPATAPGPHPRLFEIARAAPPVRPVFAFVRPPGWDDAHPEMQAGLAELVQALGDQVFEVALPPAFAQAEPERRRINFAEMARYYHRYGRDPALLSNETRAALDEGNAIPARDYLAALDWKPVLNAALDEIFERCDAILCPAAPGPAPEGLGSTGSAIFNGLWTLCGTPAVTVPLMTAGNGLPMGVQLVGQTGNDARLLRTAQWLCDWAAQ